VRRNFVGVKGFQQPDPVNGAGSPTDADYKGKRRTHELPPMNSRTQAKRSAALTRAGYPRSAKWQTFVGAAAGPTGLRTVAPQQRAVLLEGRDRDDDGLGFGHGRYVNEKARLTIAGSFGWASSVSTCPHASQR